jgi:hypothetical protein
MQLADLTLGQGQQLYAREGQVLVEGGDVFLVAGKAVQRLRQDQIQLTCPRIFEKLLVAGAEVGTPAHRGIAICSRKHPSLTLDPLPADSDLVLDRGFALQIGGVAGVDGSAHVSLLII